ncbi:uncharacterized protein LOC126992210 [Eriocheir sinensis]|uniref:uncharacterized protein LOC126992210 n=1 Tax=Eriocheir sinensis TaxID=95602 RepID=UPI0021C5EFE9|nr:uncharacterized protein LOC126992210 [Eriocheir sinensis]
MHERKNEELGEMRAVCPVRDWNRDLRFPVKMVRWQALVVGVVAVMLPLTSALVTYFFLTMLNEPITVDDTGGLIIMLVIAKLLLLSAQGIFPIDLNNVFYGLVYRFPRDADNRNSFYQVPEVEGLPCTRRLLCELETAARTSDIYLPRAPKEHEGRDPSEEEAPQEVDPITEIQIEAVRALYREDDPTGELSERGRRAVKVVEELTGAACETAYRLCPGRFTAPMYYRVIFEEINFKAHDHDLSEF